MKKLGVDDKMQNVRERDMRKGFIAWRLTQITDAYDEVEEKLSYYSGARGRQFQLVAIVQIQSSPHLERAATL